MALALLSLLISCPARAGDSLFGTVTSVKSANMVTLDYGRGSYDVRIVGIDVPSEGPIAASARAFTSRLLLGKKARMRFERRTQEGVMLGRLYTAEGGIREVAVELVRAGLATREKTFDGKYGEFSRAEREAQAARRGLWSTRPN